MRVNDEQVKKIADDRGPNLEAAVARDLLDARAWIRECMRSDAIHGEARLRGSELVDKPPPVRATDRDIETFLANFSHLAEFTLSHEVIGALAREVQAVRKLVRQYSGVVWGPLHDDLVRITGVKLIGGVP